MLTKLFCTTCIVCKVSMTFVILGLSQTIPNCKVLMSMLGIVNLIAIIAAEQIVMARHI